MIRREHGYVWLLCDDCEEEETDHEKNDDFEHMLSKGRSDGWSIRKEDRGKYVHLCPYCNANGD